MSLRNGCQATTGHLRSLPRRSGRFCGAIGQCDARGTWGLRLGLSSRTSVTAQERDTGQGSLGARRRTLRRGGGRSVYRNGKRRPLRGRRFEFKIESYRLVSSYDCCNGKCAEQEKSSTATEGGASGFFNDHRSFNHGLRVAACRSGYSCESENGSEYDFFSSPESP